MKGLGFRIFFLGVIAVVLLPFPRSEASSYCPGCTAAITGALIGLGAGIGTGIYFIHRSHTSLTGCVREADSGLSATAKDGTNYQLVNAPSQVKAGERFSLRGHKITAGSGRAFRVDRVSRDYGVCSP